MTLATITTWLSEALGLPFGLKVQNPRPLDAWRGPYDSVADAVATVPPGVRWRGMDVVVNGVRYVWKAGTANNQLVEDGDAAVAARVSFIEKTVEPGATQRVMLPLTTTTYAGQHMGLQGGRGSLCVQHRAVDGTLTTVATINGAGGMELLGAGAGITLFAPDGAAGATLTTDEAGHLLINGEPFGPDGSWQEGRVAELETDVTQVEADVLAVQTEVDAVETRVDVLDARVWYIRFDGEIYHGQSFADVAQSWDDDSLIHVRALVLEEPDPVVLPNSGTLFGAGVLLSGRYELRSLTVFNVAFDGVSCLVTVTGNPILHFCKLSLDTWTIANGATLTIGVGCQVSGTPTLQGSGKVVYAGSGEWDEARVAALESLSTRVPLAAEQAGAYTLQPSDAGKLVPVNAASPVTLTVPLNSAVAYPVGTVVQVLQQGSGQVTVAGQAGVTIHHPDGHTKTEKQWAELGLLKIDTNSWLLNGRTTA